VKEEEWKEVGKYIPREVIGAEFLWPDALRVAKDSHWTSSFLQSPTDS